ncbi:MAG TPA: hypothetical protein DCS93_12370 [Microscillaceae bacterium]|nr:hypothetical protein [Microscillaceae bacterium]
MNNLFQSSKKLPARWYLQKATSEARVLIIFMFICVVNILVYYISYLYLPTNEALLFPVLLMIGWSIFTVKRAFNYAPEVICLSKNVVTLTRNKQKYEIPFRELEHPILERASAFPFLIMSENNDRDKEDIDLIRLKVKCLNPAHFFLANQKRELLIECIDDQQTLLSQLPYTYSGNFYPSLRIRHKDACMFLQELKRRIEEASS